MTQNSIEWKSLAKMRQRFLAEHQDKKFNYLLRPEVEALLPNIDNATTHLATYALWVTGAGVSELLLLRPQDCHFQPGWVDLQIPTLKNRALKDGTISRRLVRVCDQFFIESLRRYIKTQRINKRDPVFTLSRSAIRQRLLIIGERISPPLPFSINPLTLRHSFAVNELLQGTSMKRLQELLGLKDRRSMGIYSRIAGV